MCLPVSALSVIGRCHGHLLGGARLCSGLLSAVAADVFAAVYATPVLWSRGELLVCACCLSVCSFVLMCRFVGAVLLWGCGI